MGICGPQGNADAGELFLNKDLWGYTAPSCHAKRAAAKDLYVNLGNLYLELWK
jgi:hypothetical protein